MYSPNTGELLMCGRWQRARRYSSAGRLTGPCGYWISPPVSAHMFLAALLSSATRPAPTQWTQPSVYGTNRRVPAHPHRPHLPRRPPQPLPRLPCLRHRRRLNTALLRPGQRRAAAHARHAHRHHYMLPARRVQGSLLVGRDAEDVHRARRDSGVRPAHRDHRRMTGRVQGAVVRCGE